MMYNSFKKAYISEYKMFEENLLATERYVTIDKKNYNTFSAEYRRLFLDICSGIDSLADEFCSHLDESKKTSNTRTSILKRFSQIKNDYYKNLNNVPVKTNLNENITFCPFTKFSDKTTGDWWQDYNNVKHKRTGEVENSNGNMSNYELANLKNVLVSLSAYYLLISMINNYFAKNGCEIYTFRSQLFEEIDIFATSY